MREWEKADIVFDVCTNNSEESNLFLRKFYDELSKHGKYGWHCQSFREDKVIYIGNTNYGEMWLSYKDRGKIDKIYFRTNSKDAHESVVEALVNAKQNHYDMKCYMATVIFDTKDVLFCNMSKNGIKVNSIEVGDKRLTNIIFPLYAFGEYDLQYVKMQKINYLQHLLCVYTNIMFSYVKIVCNEEMNNVCDNEWQEPNQDWVEIDEEFIDIDNKEISLSSDFFDILKIIIDSFEYSREIRLILNSMQEIYFSKMMIDEIIFEGKKRVLPGYTDLINTMLISALEPLSNIHDNSPERCKECGNLKYSIRKKVRDLCMMYLPEHLAKEIYDKGYGERSSFLHEGNAVTNEFYCGHCVPLINPVDGRSILLPASFINLNLFDYVTYLFRKLVSDLMKDDII